MASKWVDIRYSGRLIYNVNKCDYNEKKTMKKCFLSMHHPSSIDVLVGVDWGHGVGDVDHIEGVQKLHIKPCLHLDQCFSF